MPANDERDGIGIWRGGDYRFGVHGHVRQVYEALDRKFDLVIDEINTRPFNAPKWATSSQVVGFIHQLARDVWFHETPLPVAALGRYVLEPRWLRAYRDVPMFAPSQSTADSLQPYGLEQVVAVPQGSDLDPHPTAHEKEATPTFLFVGRLCSMKRPLHAIAAFRKVQRAVPEARLWVIGAGPDERRVRRAAGNGVEMLGVVSTEERNDYMGRAHALIATSVREGWGLVVSEAAAVGTGTIGYAVAGLLDSVRATGGELVLANEQMLAEAMLRVARDVSTAPLPISTGTVPFADVAALLLVHTEMAARA
jgi:glycosyltransferase involved in cell wall biosynthesis